jgi:rare lipoprotein A
MRGRRGTSGAAWSALALCLVGAACRERVAPVSDKAVADAAPEPERVVRELRGIAIWYGADWHGKKTASGERFDRHALTAAHRSLPLGTRVRVTVLSSGRQVIVRVNDRGPYGRDRRRIIDLSEAAARELGILERGSARVLLEILAPRAPPSVGQNSLPAGPSQRAAREEPGKSARDAASAGGAPADGGLPTR